MTEDAKNPSSKKGFSCFCQFTENKNLRRYFLQKDLKSELSKYHTLIKVQSSNGGAGITLYCWRESDTEMFYDLSL